VVDIEPDDTRTPEEIRAEIYQKALEITSISHRMAKDAAALGLPVPRRIEEIIHGVHAVVRETRAEPLITNVTPARVGGEG
jgi:hypothetical protein